MNEAIDAAFGALEARGIVALQATGYSVSDAVSDAREIAAKRPSPPMWASWASPPPAQGSPVGVCFYTLQDAESGVAGKGLHVQFVSFGATKESSLAADRALGCTIVVVLRAHGVPVEWDEDPEHPIRILPFEWYRLAF